MPKWRTEEETEGYRGAVVYSNAVNTIFEFMNLHPSAEDPAWGELLKMDMDALQVILGSVVDAKIDGLLDPDDVTVIQADPTIFATGFALGFMISRIAELVQDPDSMMDFCLGNAADIQSSS